MTDPRIESLSRLIRDVPDFPKPGIVFKDLTPALRDPEGLRLSLDLMVESFGDHVPTAVVGIESRGFIYGAPVAARLGVGFVPVRKPRKLPYRTLSESYVLEYGEDTLEIHADALTEKDSVFIIDDLLATGGTMEATCRLVERLGARVLGCRVFIELAFLEGRSKLAHRDVASIISY